MNENTFTGLKIPTATIQKYQRYLPTAFSDNLTLLQKTNMIIEFLNVVINQVNENSEYTNKLIDDYLKLKKWLEGDGLKDNVSIILSEWYENGLLSEIINETIFDMKANQVEVDILSRRVLNIENQLESNNLNLGDWSISQNEDGYLEFRVR